MPRLILFAPCERVIFGYGDMSASLIIIMQELQVKKEIPKDATIIFQQFSVFSQWIKSPEDEGKTFEQKITMACGNEKPAVENISVFQMTAARLHRAVVTFRSFPALKAGEYDLSLSIRVQGESRWPPPIASYPMNVTLESELQPQIQ